MANEIMIIDVEVKEKESKVKFENLLKMADKCAKNIQKVFTTIGPTINSSISHTVSGISAVLIGTKNVLVSLSKSVLGYLGANQDIIGLINNIKNVIGDMSSPIENILNNGIKKCVDSANQLVNSFVNAGVAQGAWASAGQVMSETMTKAFDQINSLIQVVGQSFLNIWKNGTGEQTFNLILGILAAISDIVNVLISGFQTAWESASVGEAIIQNIWNLFNNVLSIITTLLNFIGQLVSMIDWTPILAGVEIISQALADITSIFDEGLQGIIECLLNGDFSGAGQVLSDTFQNVINYIIEFIGSIDWVQLGLDVAQMISDGIGAIIEFIMGIDWLSVLTSVGQLCIEGLMAGLQFLGTVVLDLFGKMVDTVFEFLGINGASCKFFEIGLSILTGIKEGLTGVAEWFGELFTNAYNKVKEAFSSVSTFFTGMWENIKSTFGNVVSWFKERFSEAWTAVKNVFSSGGKIFDGIKDGILNGLKTVINGIIGGINKVIKVPFDGINYALKQIRNVDILGFQPFSWIGTISVPQIPKLAHGGIVNRPTLAMIGEAGREAVLPLQNNTQWMKELADMISLNRQNNNEESTINLYIDGEKLYQWFIKKQRKERIVLNG